MKAYKYKTKQGENFSVRFHNTGCVTIVDKNGEHEIGIWKKPENVDCIYKAKMFESENVRWGWKQEDLAYYLLDDYRRKLKVH